MKNIKETPNIAWTSGTKELRLVIQEAIDLTFVVPAVLDGAVRGGGDQVPDEALDVLISLVMLQAVHQLKAKNMIWNQNKHRLIETWPHLLNSSVLSSNYTMSTSSQIPNGFIYWACISSCKILIICSERDIRKCLFPGGISQEYWPRFQLKW